VSGAREEPPELAAALAGLFLRTSIHLAMFVVAGAALGLMLIGIHNAWDTLTLTPERKDYRFESYGAYHQINSLAGPPLRSLRGQIGDKSQVPRGRTGALLVRLGWSRGSHPADQPRPPAALG